MEEENNSFRQLPIEISKEEIEIINDIRQIDFGKISLTIQNGRVIVKEVTSVIKMFKKNNGSNGAGCGKLKKYEDHLAMLLIIFLPIIEVFGSGL